MEDSKIVELYWQRNEEAIAETASKYGRYCGTIAYNILRSSEDAEECVNDTYMRAWNAIPPHRPNRLSTFLGKITRNLALNKYKGYNAKKRGEGQTDLILSELEACISTSDHVEGIIDELAVVEAINSFLSGLTKMNRAIFVRRYWYMDSVKDIADRLAMSENRIALKLFRMRKELRVHLEREGITL